MPFQFFRQIRVNHSRVLSTLTNFPMLFWGYPEERLFELPDYYTRYLRTVANGGRCHSSTGLDIAFYSDPYGNRLLPFERVSYDPVTGQCEFYVRLAVLSDTVDTFIYIMYGNPSPVDLSNRNGTWDDTYVGVYHWGDGVTLDCSDSTHYGNHGTAQETPIAAPGLLGTGLTGGSLGCMGAGYVRVPSPDNASFDFNDGMTFEYSYYNNPVAPAGGGNVANGDILNKFIDFLDDPLHGGNGFKVAVNDDFQPGLPIQYVFNGIQTVPPFFPFFGTGESNVPFVNTTFTYDQTNAYLMLQGNINVSGSPQDWGGPLGTIERAPTPLFIGAGRTALGNAAHRWPGWIDEVRLSNQPRTHEWTGTTAANIFDNNHLFFFVGPEQPAFNAQPRVYVIT